MGTTKIEWCDVTWNPITGCTPISEACDHCYAQRMATRLAGRYGYPADDPFRVTQHSGAFFSLRKLKKPQRIFVCSMGDLFHEDLRGLSGDGLEWSAVYSVFAEMIANPQHTFMVLTKRPANALSFFKEWIRPGEDKVDHIWLGVTAENQARYDERWSELRKIPAGVRFISFEPLLGGIECGWNLPDDAQFPKPDLVICGGETGPGARPVHPDLVRSLRDQCQSAGVPFFFKGWGDWLPGKNEYNETLKRGAAHWQDGHWGVRKPSSWSRYATWISGNDSPHFGRCDTAEFRAHNPEFLSVDAFAMRVGKKAAGRLLDGREWNEFPSSTR